MDDSEKRPLLKSRYPLLDGSSNHDLEVGCGPRRTSGIEGVIPVSLSWNNVRVSVDVPGKRKFCCGESTPATEKVILKGVTGLVKPGTLLAIMGASGAGKSTLLNVLTRRNIRGYNVTGDICINGWQIGEKIKNVSAYVQQDDIFLGTLTVREQLQFRALLRMDKRLNREQRLIRVEEVLTEMGLQKVASSKIGEAGGTMKGISGGERKRLSFASEALTNPPLLFCDEPTSGLDSFMAQNIVHTLKNMASRGRAILCTIHQPSSDVFAMFNQILLLAEGRVAFMGSKEETMEFFTKMSFPCPPNFNPADHYILTLAIVPGREEECKDRANEICDAYEKSEKAANIADENSQLKQSIRMSNSFDDGAIQRASTKESRYEASWLTQCRYLLWRSWICQFRDVVLFKVRVVQSLIAAVFLGLIYLRLSVDQKGVMSINGALFCLLINQSFSNLFAVINSFPIEMGIFLREYGSRIYRSDVYFISKTLCEVVRPHLKLICIHGESSKGRIPLDFITPLSAPREVEKPRVWGFDEDRGVPATILIPDYFIWLKYISWFKYASEILMVNQWDNIKTISCDNSSLSTGDDPTCLFPTGQSVLNYNSAHKDNIPIDLVAMTALMIGFRVLAYFGLLVRARRSKE